MSPTVVTNEKTLVRFMTKEQYDALTEHAPDQMWCVESGAISDSYVSSDGSEWSMKFSNGFVIQGGRRDTSATGIELFTLPVPMAGDNYTVQGTYVDVTTSGTATSAYYSYEANNSRTSTGFGLRSFAGAKLNWTVLGMSA